MNFKYTNKQQEGLNILTEGNLHTMLFGGSRSGKTFLMVRSIIIRALKCKSRHLIIRYRYNHAMVSIWHDTLPKVLKISFPQLAVQYHNKYSYIEFSNGSEIWIGGLDNEKISEKVLGREYSTIFLNECSQLDYKAVINVVTRLAEKTQLVNKAYYDCNPPSMKHWTYLQFIKKLLPQTLTPLKHPNNYKSLLMNPEDNQENLPANYIEGYLEDLPKSQKDRFKLGLFASDVEGALWEMDWIIKAQAAKMCEERVTVIGVDPAVTANENSALTGIIVASSDGECANILADYSLKASPERWGQTVINAYYKHGANSIVVEVNQGGDMCKSVLHSIDKNVKVVQVRASQGKFARAEPVTTFYERGEIYHAPGLEDLENELTTYVPISSKESPDRLDAMVWALTHLLLVPKQQANIKYFDF